VLSPIKRIPLSAVVARSRLLAAKSWMANEEEFIEVRRFSRGVSRTNL
jgi:hypothetical protein